MEWHSNIHEALLELYPTIRNNIDYIWIRSSFEDEPVMQYWNEDKLGPLDILDVEAKCFEIKNRVVVPKSISKAQALIVLYNHGLLEDVQDKLMNHPYVPARIWFENANEWLRDNVYIQAVGAELELTEEQIDELFIEAATYI